MAKFILVDDTYVNMDYVQNIEVVDDSDSEHYSAHALIHVANCEYETLNLMCRVEKYVEYSDKPYDIVHDRVFKLLNSNDTVIQFDW